MFDSSRFNDLVKEKGLTKAYIADKLGRRQSIFSDWAKCKSKPSDAHLQIVAKYLGCVPEYLLGETDNPIPEKQKKAAPTGEQPEREVIVRAKTVLKDLSDDEAQEVLRYAEYVISQRKQ